MFGTAGYNLGLEEEERVFLDITVTSISKIKEPEPEVFPTLCVHMFLGPSRDRKHVGLRLG